MPGNCWSLLCPWEWHQWCGHNGWWREGSLGVRCCWQWTNLTAARPVASLCSHYRWLWQQLRAPHWDSWEVFVQTRSHDHMKTMEGSRTNSRAFINWIKLTTVNNPTFFLKYHLCLRFEWIESGNIFYFGITSKDRPWPRTAPPAPLFNFHWISVSSWLIVQDETRNNMCYFPVPTVSFYSSCLCNLHTQLFLGTCRDLVVGFPLNTKVHRCSSTLFKMAQHFHVHNSNLHNSPVCLNSSLDF